MPDGEEIAQPVGNGTGTGANIAQTEIGLNMRMAQNLSQTIFLSICSGFTASSNLKMCETQIERCKV